jgi:hypothetical protein
MRPTRVTATVGVAALAVATGMLALALTPGGASRRRRASAPFAWLKPTTPPTGWKVARTPGGAVLAYPPGWRAIATDRGTATVALVGDRGLIEGYLNATPKSGSETLANWRRFRPQHNLGEGERRVRLLAATSGARFRSGRGSCVIDSYMTSRASYREIACLVSGLMSSAVVVAAAPSASWARQLATLRRAVSSFVA